MEALFFLIFHSFQIQSEENFCDVAVYKLWAGIGMWDINFLWGKQKIVGSKKPIDGKIEILENTNFADMSIWYGTLKPLNL